MQISIRARSWFLFSLSLTLWHGSFSTFPLISLRIIHGSWKKSTECHPSLLIWRFILWDVRNLAQESQWNIHEPVGWWFDPSLPHSVCGTPNAPDSCASVRVTYRDKNINTIIFTPTANSKWTCMTLDCGRKPRYWGNPPPPADTRCNTKEMGFKILLLWEALNYYHDIKLHLH